MSEGAIESQGTGPEQSQEVQNEQVEQQPVAEQQQEEKHNPAWDELLGIIPSQLHSQVTPHLKQWDRNYQDGIQKVHSQYADYKPFVENKVNPQEINFALGLLNAVNTKPQEVVNALQNYLKAQGMSSEEAREVAEEVTGEQGQTETEVPEELFQHPKFQQMEQQLTQMVNLIQGQQEQEIQAQQDQELAEELDSLREELGEFDEEFVITKAINNPNMTLRQCVEAYHTKISELVAQKQRPNAPKVLGPGGAAPDNQITKADLNDSKTRKSIIQQMLQQASQS